MFYDNLDLPDRASLALTCKPLAFNLDSCGLLAWDTKQISRLQKPQGDPVADLIKTRLGRDWFPKNLKYCCKCGKYVPRSKAYWRVRMHQELFWKGGHTAEKYRRWRVEPDIYYRKRTVLENEFHRWNEPKPQTCPRCKLLA